MTNETKPVAWRVKDYADGWTVHRYEHEAHRAARNGNLIEPLYTRAPINRPSPEAGESGLVERHISHEEWRGIRITSYRWKSPIPTELQGSKWQWAYTSHWSTKPDAERLLPFGPVSELVTRLQAELAEARKERDGEKAARRSLSMLAADEVDTANALRDLLFRARWYVNDALEAHEHSDGRDLLREIDAALPVQALASLSPAKDEDPTHD